MSPAVRNATKAKSLPESRDRADVALRLKAARWLAGRPAPPGAKKNPVVPLSHEDLAQHPILLTNGISAAKLSQIERCVRDARPMELQAIAEALEIPSSFLLADDPFAELRDGSDGSADEVIGYLRQLVGGLAPGLVDQERSSTQRPRQTRRGVR